MEEIKSEMTAVQVLDPIQDKLIIQKLHLKTIGILIDHVVSNAAAAVDGDVATYYCKKDLQETLECIMAELVVVEDLAEDMKALCAG